MIDAEWRCSRCGKRLKRPSESGMGPKCERTDRAIRAAAQFEKDQLKLDFTEYDSLLERIRKKEFVKMVKGWFS